MSILDPRFDRIMNDHARRVAAIAPRSKAAAPAADAPASTDERTTTTAMDDKSDVLAALEPLNVYRPGGTVIEVETLRAVCREVLSKPSFNARQVRQALQRAGAPRGSEFRGADRLLEQLRDMGAIRYNRSKPSLGWDVV